MINFIVLTLLMILVTPSTAFADKQCPSALSHSNVEKTEQFSNESQDMMLIASLMASQMQTTSQKINSSLILLSAITEVKVAGQNKGSFHNLSLIGGTLFTVFKRLNILENFQNFLLNQIGLSESNLGPFSMSTEGELILHLNTSPAISLITSFSYDEAMNLLLNNINELNQDKVIQNKQEKGALQNPFHFPEYFFLAILESDISLQKFLFDALNTKDIIEIRSIFHSLFNDLKQTVYPSNLFFKPVLDKETIIQTTILLIQGGMSIKGIAKRLRMNRNTLRGWLNEYERENGPIKERRRKPHTIYSQKQKDTFVQRALLLIQEGTSIGKAAKKLDLRHTTLRRWLDEHEQQNGPIKGRKRNRSRETSIYLQEKKKDIIQEVILWIQNGVNVGEAAKKQNMNESTLSLWLNEYEREYGPINGRQRWTRTIYFQEDKDAVTLKAVDMLEQNITVAEIARRLDVQEKILHQWLDEYEMENGPIRGRKHLSFNSYSPEEKELITHRAVQLFQEEDMNVERAAKKLGMNKTTLRKWLNEYEQQNGPIEGRRQNRNRGVPIYYSQEKKNEIIQEIKLFIQNGVSIEKAARKLEISARTLHQWLNEYEKEHGRISGRKHLSFNSYSPEQKKAMTQKAVRLIRKGVNISEAARSLRMNESTLQKWLDNYEQKHGRISERQRAPNTAYSPKQRKTITQKAISLFKKEKNMNVTKAAKKLGVHEDILRLWLNQYEQKKGPIKGRQKPLRTTYSQKQRKAITQRAVQLFQERKNMSVVKAANVLEISEDTLRPWLNKYEQEEGSISGKQQVFRKTYSRKQKEAIAQKAILLIQESMSITKAAKKLGVHQSNLQRWLHEYEQKYGIIIGRQQRPYKTPSQEKKTAIELSF